MARVLFPLITPGVGRLAGYRVNRPPLMKSIRGAAYPRLAELYPQVIPPPVQVVSTLPKVRPAAGHQVISPAAWRSKFYAAGRGVYRIFNAAEYRFYRSNSGPPAESDSPFATSATLPATPADTYADGTWYLSVSYFNGVIDSGFLALGTNGETYLVLEISGGSALSDRPSAPLDVRLEQRPSGVVRVHGIYNPYPDGSNAADEWALNYTTDGSDPAADSPIYTASLPSSGLAIFAYDLPSQSHGTTIKARLQVRRDLGGGSYRYSSSSIVTTTADAQGPSAPTSGLRWTGRLPEDL